MTPPTLTIRVVREATVPAGPTCDLCAERLVQWCSAFKTMLQLTLGGTWDRPQYAKCAPCLAACAEAERGADDKGSGQPESHAQFLRRHADALMLAPHGRAGDFGQQIARYLRELADALDKKHPPAAAEQGEGQ